MAENNATQTQGIAAGTSPNATNQTGKIGKPSIFRYPTNMRIEKDTDYLELKIADYQAPGLSLGSINSEKLDLSSIGKFTEASTTQKFQDPKTTTTILLPIPQSITDSSSVNWGEESFNPLDVLGLASGDAALNLDTDKGMEMLSGATSAIKDQNTQKAAIAAITGKLANTLGRNIPYQSVIAKATGQVFNQNLELLFNGATIRSFPFNFDFAPRDNKEAQIVKQIIRILKVSMVPRAESSGIFLKTPRVFQLTYKKGGKKHPFLNSFKPMALIDMAVNYTASGTYATYYEGTPVHMTLNLTFKELNPIYDIDYDKVPLEEGVGYLSLIHI